MPLQVWHPELRDDVLDTGEPRGGVPRRLRSAAGGRGFFEATAAACGFRGVRRVQVEADEAEPREHQAEET